MLHHSSLYKVCDIICSYYITSTCLSTLVPPTVQAANSSLLGVVYRNVSIVFIILRASPEVSLDNIKWTFTTSSGGSRDITNSTDERLMFSDNLLQLTIRNISMGDEGMYTLTATNPAGVRSGVVNLSVEGNIFIMTINMLHQLLPRLCFIFIQLLLSFCKNQ